MDPGGSHGVHVGTIGINVIRNLLEPLLQPSVIHMQPLLGHTLSLYFDIVPKYAFGHKTDRQGHKTNLSIRRLGDPKPMDDVADQDSAKIHNSKKMLTRAILGHTSDTFSYVSLTEEAISERAILSPWGPMEPLVAPWAPWAP